MKSTRPVAARSSSASNIATQPAPSTGSSVVQAEFVTTFKAFLAGDGDLATVRREIADSLWVSLEPAAAIESRLKASRKKGVLAPADFRVLLADVQRITTEQTPTDARIAPGGSRLVAGTTKKATVKPPKLTSPQRGRVSAARPKSVSGTAEPALGSTLKDRYQLEELVADGPMGKVFRASDQLKQQAGVNPAVAIKMLNPDLRADDEALARLRQEAFQVQRLTHPNIINVFDFDQAGATDFITMEWLTGESLASLLDRLGSRPLERSEVQRIVAGVVAGLSHAHAQGIVHGDIKPANIYLCKNGGVKIVDFGVVRGPAVAARTNGAAAYAVTPGYASCELFEGKEPCVQDDVFALACTIYRMVAGFRPYGRQTALQAEAGHHVAMRPDGLDLGQWLALCRGLSFRRDDRLAEIGELLEVFIDRPKTTSRRGWAKSVAAVLFAALVVGVQVWFGLDETQSVPDGTGAPQVAVVREPVEILPERAESERQIVSGLSEADHQVFDEQPAIADDPMVQDPDDTFQPASPISVAQVETLPEATAPELEGDDFSESRQQIQAEEAFDEDPVDSVVEDQQNISAAIDTTSTSAEVAPEAAVVAPDAAVIASTYTGPTGFSRNRYNVGEGDGIARLTVTVPPDLDTDLSVRLIIESGSAVADSDFVQPAVARLDFSPGRTEKTVFIPLIADAIGEHIEEFTVRLEAPPGTLSFDNASALIVIIDDD